MSSSQSARQAQTHARLGAVLTPTPFRIVVAGAALAALLVALQWPDADTDDNIVTAGVSAGSTSASFNDRFGAASFGERFQVALDAPLKAMPANAAAAAASTGPAPAFGGQVAWFDPSYSFGGDRRAFARPAQPAAPQIAAAAPPPATRPEPVVKPVVVAALPEPSLREATAAAVPMPATRPQDAAKPELRGPRARAAYSHEALVRKARAVLLAQAKSGPPSWFDKLFHRDHKPEADHAPVMAYASADADVTGSVAGSAGAATADAAEINPIDRLTAVYDITAKTVYMPDGSKLEAHSGLGPKLDKPDYVHVRMHGATPPHVYDITPREALFHGVAALRLTPLGGAGAIHGRTGLLAHTYMLGPNGDSNGCVSFKDYDRFLNAYHAGQVKRLVVVGAMQ